MKKIIFPTLLLMLSVSIFAQKGYVFTQKYITASPAADVSSTWFVTQDQCKMKLEYSNGTFKGTTYFVPDMSGSQLLTYNDGAVPQGVQKGFFRIPIAGIKGNDDQKVSRLSVSKTGESKTIGGLACEQYLIKTNKNETEMWVTKKFSPNFFQFHPFFVDHAALAGLFEDRIKGFPVESTTKDLSGKMINQYQLISAVESDLSTADFKVPAEYKSPEEIKGAK